MKLLSLLNPKKRSIAQRLTFALVFAVTFTTLIGAGWVYLEVTERARKQLEMKSDGALAHLESVLTIPLWNYNQDVVKTIGSTLMEDKSYQSISISDSSGNIIFTQQRTPEKGNVVREALLKHKDEVIGRVVLTVSSKVIKEQVREILFSNLLMLLSILITITVCTVLLIRYFFKKPLNDLQAVAYAYGSGDYSIPEVKSIYLEFKPLLNVLAKMGEKILEQISELQEREQRLQAIFDGANDAIFLHDADSGKILHVNRRACEMYNYGPEEFSRLSAEDISSGETPYTQDNTKKGIAMTLAGKTPTFQWRAKDKEGRLFWVEVNMRSVVIGAQRRVLVFARDITERKLKDEELKGYREHLEEMVEERTEALKKAHEELIRQERLAVLGQLTATVSHELRNPLAVIRTSAFYLRGKLENKDEKTNKHLKRIEAQVEQCDSIVGELLEYTRSSRAEFSEDKINAFLDKILDEIHGANDIPLIREFSVGLPGIVFDPGKMGRVIINLINNALQAVREKAERDAEIEVVYRPEVCIRTSRGQDGGIAIEVIDNGIGMDEKTLRQAFEPLFTTRARGTGLGLANVKKIIEEHGGTVSIESSLNMGTKTTILLPLKQ